jgi:hypothetical protein
MTDLTIYELAPGTLGADTGSLSAVPAGKRRYILRAQAVHTVAAGARMTAAVTNAAFTREVAIAESGAAWPANVVWPIPEMPQLLAEGDRLIVQCVTGPAELITIAAQYVEWRPDSERPPWQALLSQ